MILFSLVQHKRTQRSCPDTTSNRNTFIEIVYVLNTESDYTTDAHLIDDDATDAHIIEDDANDAHNIENVSPEAHVIEEDALNLDERTSTGVIASFSHFIMCVPLRGNRDSSGMGIQRVDEERCKALGERTGLRKDMSAQRESHCRHHA